MFKNPKATRGLAFSALICYTSIIIDTILFAANYFGGIYG